MFDAFRSRLFRAFGDWVIQRAARTPYFHITHGDGKPYMDRYWLARVGGSSELGQEPARHPWVSLRVHNIRSSDWPEFHDHPWDFVTLILRGEYDELKPITQDGTVMTRQNFRAGSLRRVRAADWHYIELPRGEDAWTLVFTFPKCQAWGFLFEGQKMPWREYLAMRRQRAALRLRKRASA